MADDGLGEIDPEDAAEVARERELYLRRVDELNRQLAPWRGSGVVAMSYSFGPTHSPFTSTAENSILAFQLSGPAGRARLRCIASWRVSFLSLWINSRIEASYLEAGIVRLVISDGERLHVECSDAEFEPEPPGF